MPLDIIGAGFGRTGTLSLCRALEKLGYPTHHMTELLKNHNQDPGIWIRASDHPDTHEDEWEKAYENYRAAVDWPTCVFYRELSERYPEAKVILTVRSAESWVESFCSTVVPILQKDDVFTERQRRITALCRHLMMDGLLEREPEKVQDKEYLCKAFNDHVAQVKRTIPSDRLLVYELGSGWEPLCQFLGKEVPDEPFPFVNTRETFQETYPVPCPSKDSVDSL